MNPRRRPHIWCEGGAWRVMYAWLPGRRIKDFDTFEDAAAFADFMDRLLRHAGVAR